MSKKKKEKWDLEVVEQYANQGLQFKNFKFNNRWGLNILGHWIILICEPSFKGATTTKIVYIYYASTIKKGSLTHHRRIDVRMTLRYDVGDTSSTSDFFPSTYYYYRSESTTKLMNGFLNWLWASSNIINIVFVRVEEWACRPQHYKNSPGKFIWNWQPSIKLLWILPFCVEQSNFQHKRSYPR